MFLSQGREAIIELADGIRCALDGDAVLFVGAGVSFLAANEAGETVPDVDTLKDLLLEQPVGTGSKHPLDRIAGSVLRKKGADFVYDILKRRLAVTTVDDRLRALYELPWRRIYTTNYDNAIEVSRKSKPQKSIILEDDTSAATPGAILHVNGYIDRVKVNRLNEDLILTDQSYATNRFLESDWFKFFLRDVRNARFLVFVGYSLADLDIQRALIADPSLSRKTSFFISPWADDLEVDALAPYGIVEPGGIDALVEAVKLGKADYDPARFPEAFLALREIQPEDAAPDADLTNAEKLTGQLVFGRLPEAEVLHDEKLFGDHPFVVTRHQDRAVFEALRRGPYRDVLLVGELASGKTASALVLSRHLLSLGYRVFYAHKGATLLDELSRIASRREKIAVVFEHYAIFEQEIRDFAARRQQDHRIVLTERAVTHELIPNLIERTPHLGPVFESHLNVIHPDDVAEFEALVNFGGFWGERAGASEEARKRIITGRLESSLYKLLVEVIKSEKVQAEVRALLEPLRNDRRATKLFVSSFIVNVLGSNFSINDWQTVFDAQWVRRVMRIYSEQVRHFLTLQGDAIFPRAGVLSAYILSTFSDNELVRECLLDLYERASRSEASDPEFVSLRINLTRYGSIEPLFFDPGKADHIFRYYEEIRVFGNTRNNADYWLQVGIAATIYDDLKRAENAFDNAYAREKAKAAPNLRKIDNYYSRFQMRKAIEIQDHDAAFAMFIEANERLKKQMFLDVNRHYPYKTGRYYTDIAAKHYHRWDEEKQTRFRDEARAIREKAFEWKASKEFSPDVAILIRETTNLLGRLEGDAA